MKQNETNRRHIDVPAAPAESYQLDAVALAGRLRERAVALAAEDHATSDARLAGACQAIWAGEAAGGGLVSDLWVEAALPARGSEVTLDALAAAGRFDAGLMRHLDANGTWPRGRTLFEHQAAAIDAAADGGEGDRPAVVVTAPTGGGKTESFLFPALDDLVRNPRRPGERGVRCLVLYPMNALVNDQIERVHDYLRAAGGGDPDHGLRLFHFTSETPEDHARRGDAAFREFDPPRVQTRQEARGLHTRRVDGRGGREVAPDAPDRRPAPDVLITNYSMLAYMLCRPQDDHFFGPALRSVVLDEAHLYTATLAAEITLLLRRVLLRCGRSPEDVLHLATSATLGGGPDALRDFAAKLFGKRPGRVRVVQGQRSKLTFGDGHPPEVGPTPAGLLVGLRLDGPTITLRDGEPALHESADACETLRQGLPLLVGRATVDAAADETFPARLLYRTLSHAPLVHRLADALNPAGGGAVAKRIDELARVAFGADDDEARRATALVLKLAAAARDGAGRLPLLPHRAHVLTRPADGVNVCLNPECTAGEEHRPLAGLGKLLPGELEACDACGSPALAVWRCSCCGRPHLGAVAGDDKRHRPARWQDKKDDDEDDAHADHVVLLDPAGVGGDRLHLDADASKCGAGKAVTSLAKAAAACAGCGEPLAKRAQAMASKTPLALSVAAETTLAALPPYPAQNAHLPARGRRLLAFSDSRAEAAKLGPRLTSQHEDQLARAAILEAVAQNEGGGPDVAAYLARKVKGLREDLATAPEGPMRDEIRRDLNEAERKLAQATTGLGFDAVVDATKRTARFAELLDADAAESHGIDDGPSSWSADDWERNRGAVAATAAARVARQLAQPIRTGSANGLENLGLVEAIYPGLADLRMPSAITDSLPAGAVGRLAPLAEVWPDFLAACLDEARHQGAVTTGSDERDRAVKGGEAAIFIGLWSVKGPGTKNDTAGFVSRMAPFAGRVLAACGIEDEVLAKRLAGAAFDALLAAAGRLAWLQHDDAAGGRVRVDLSRLSFCIPRRLFRCGRTGHVFPRSVLGRAPAAGTGELRQATADELDADPRLGRLRREYRDGDVFKIGLWGEEHSAQLASGENRRRQELFKAGARNVLSSTTTMELGIDIGGLNGVLLANVPPGVANYLQRGGRAGRRSDGSAAVVTFARPTPFDRQVFGDFGDYLGREMRRPTVFLDRPRLARRHLHALLLGEFFRRASAQGDRTGAMDAYGTIGGLTAAPLTQKWPGDAAKPVALRRGGAFGWDVGPAAWLDATPDDSLAGRFARWLQDEAAGDGALRDGSASLLADTPLIDQLDEWPSLTGEIAAKFREAVAPWRRDYAGLLAEWSAVRRDDQRSRANALHHQLNKLAQWTTIAYLGDRQFLPSFGFPINLKTLYVQEKPRRADDGPGRFTRDSDYFKLSRGGLLALAEYAPGSKLFAGGKVIESRGLRRTWHGGNDGSPFGRGGWYAECTAGHLTLSEQKPDACEHCGEGFKSSPGKLLYPDAGFTTSGVKPPVRGGQTDRAGTADRRVVWLPPGGETVVQDRFAGMAGLTARYREDGRVVVLNRGEHGHGFAVCARCGHADSERRPKNGRLKDRENLPPGFAKHSPVNQTRGAKRCLEADPQLTVLRERTLASSEATDVLTLTLPDHADARDEAAVATLALALRLAGARLLELDPRELAADAIPGEAGRPDVALYDTAAGGAGHVRELLSLGRPWLDAARDAMYLDADHHDRCHAACLRCLLSFDSQRQVDQRRVDRRRGLTLLDGLLGV